MDTLLVVGGSGFIGRAICRFAVREGHDVRSVSRGGRPETDAPWADEVSWTSADLFRPDAWRGRLDGVDAVVHSVGVISESVTAGVTFERVNGDSAIITALEAERAGVDTFVFCSSSVKPPGVRNAYLTAKRRAETAIADLDLDNVTIRPGPVYGPDQPHFPRPLNWLCSNVDDIEPVAGRLGEARPLSVDRVARAALDSAFDPSDRLLTVEAIHSA